MNNFTSSISQLEEAMAAEGLLPPDGIIADGEIHRFRVDGDQARSKNGWYVVSPTYPSRASFGSWKLDVTKYWFPQSSKGGYGNTRFRDFHEIERDRSNRKNIYIERQKKSSSRAKKLWGEASSEVGGHPYLVTKGVGSHNLRRTGSRLLVPLYKDKELVNIQSITEEGAKYFLKGGVVKGAYSIVGDLSLDNPTYICEGWATAASLYEMTSRTAICAMNASNLVEVAKYFKALLPSRTFVIAADDDRNTKGNPGLRYAEKAAKAICSELVLPNWPNGAPSKLTDFNDLHCFLEGRQ